MYVADHVRGPDAEHKDQDCTGEVGGFAAAQTGRLAEEQEQDVQHPHGERSQHLGIEEVGSAERGFLDQDRAEDEADRHARKAEEEHRVGDAFEGVEWRQPVERSPAGGAWSFELGLQTALCNEIEDGGQKTETKPGISGKEGRDVRDQPAGANALGWKGIARRSERGDEDKKERDRQSEDSQGHGVVDPPSQEKESGYEESKKGFGFAGADGYPAVGLDEHFYGRNEVEENGHSAEVDAGLACAR